MVICLIICQPVIFLDTLIKTWCFLVHGSNKNNSSAQTHARKGNLKTQYCFAARVREAPDIERRVCARGEQPVGEFARTEIVGYTDYDLIAEPV